MNKYIIEKLNEDYYNFSNIKEINLHIACCGNDENAILTAQSLLNNYKANIMVSYSKFDKNSDISQF